jgi:phage-related protein
VHEDRFAARVGDPCAECDPLLTHGRRLRARPVRLPETGDSISAMGWGFIETEPEVTAWLDSLTDDDFGQAERYIDLLADQGVHLREPFTRQLDGKLRELRFYLDRQPTRISYYIATGRIIVLLTVFTKTKPRERAEIDRARRAMKRCVEEGHITSNEDNP